MRFISVGPHPWLDGLRELGAVAVQLDTPSPRPAEGSAPASEDLERGEALRSALAPLLAVAGTGQTVLLDSDGGGMAWVDPSAEGPRSIVPLHESLNVVLISLLSGAWFDHLAQGDWPRAWSALLSRRWVKAVRDAELARELTAFGVPHVLHVPAAAGGGTVAWPPCVRAGHVVAWAGGTLTHPGSDQKTFETGMLLPGVLAHGVRAGAPGVSFFDIVFHLHGLLEPLRENEDLQSVSEKARQYFQMRAHASVRAALVGGEQFVRFLRPRLGDRFHVMDSQAAPARSQPAQGRSTAFDKEITAGICLTLPSGDGCAGPDEGVFDAAAAGRLVLAHRSVAIREFLRPGAECDEFADERDLLARIEHYTAHPAESRRIAEAGRRRVQAEHRVAHRLPAVLRYLSAMEPDAAVAPCAAPPRSAAAPALAAPRPAVHEPLAPPTPQDCRDAASDGSTLAARSRVRTLLILQNPGRVSRHYLEGVAKGAVQLGLQVRVLELGELWAQRDLPREQVARQVAEIVRRERIDAVLGYTFNGAFDLPLVRRADGSQRTLFAELGLPHLMLWTDHPQWAHERAALQPTVQTVLNQENHHHFLKVPYAAEEVSHMLGWSRVHGLPVGEDPDLVRPRRDLQPEFDAVLIVGSPPHVPTELSSFVEQDKPDENAILGAVAGRTQVMLGEVWSKTAPSALCDKLRALGRDWVDAKRADPRAAAFRLFLLVARRHEDAAAWLRGHPLTYFDALHAMWEFGRWQRTLYPLLLARHFRVGVFGHDWSSVGMQGSAKWVDYAEQAAVYARGRVAININQCNDEEGVSHKAFQITAAGAACLHLDRVGLADLFAPGREIESFQTFEDAREKLADLVSHEARRTDLAAAGLSRFRRDHTWARRLERMLQLTAQGQADASNPPSVEAASVAVAEVHAPALCATAADAAVVRTASQ
ncbi:MAG: glycosyltransferase [Phycisphaerales bacterium]|nr:glycosyltransferase [Phycisphaerales bacterium]